MNAKVAMSLVVISAGMAVGLAACESLSDRIHHKEDLLAAAGFQVRPANTPKREEALKTLPPHKFVMRTKGDNVMYFYADPLVCNCLYTGDQKAFDAYKQEVFQKRIADEQQLTAQMYAEPPGWWGGWDWGPWGPGPVWW
jgi:hypothetical protein